MTAKIRLGYGRYAVMGKSGTLYNVERSYGVGTTKRGWESFVKRDGRWVGARFTGDTLREVARLIETDG